MIFRLGGVACLAMSILVVRGLAQPVSTASACSNVTLHDRYGYRINGTTNGNTVIFVGQFATNGSGFLAGKETVNVNGTITDYFTLGSYKLKSNCTGTLEIDAGGGPRVHLAITVTSGEKEIEMIETDSGATEVGTAEAQNTTSCSTSALTGAFGLQGTGQAIGVGPLGFAGQISLHGDGTLNGSETVSVNGSITTATVSGSYLIGNHCDGKAVIQVEHQGTIHLNLEVVRNDERVVFIQTDANTLVSGVLQK